MINPLVKQAAELRGVLASQPILRNASFGCCHRDGKLMVMLPNRLIINYPQSGEVEIDISSSQVTRFFHTDKEILRKAVIAAVNGG